MKSRIDELETLLTSVTIEDCVNIALLLDEQLILSELIYIFSLGKARCLRDIAKTPIKRDFARHYKVKFFGGPKANVIFTSSLVTYFIDRLLFASQFKPYSKIVKKSAAYLWKVSDTTSVDTHI